MNAWCNSRGASERLPSAEIGGNTQQGQRPRLPPQAHFAEAAHLQAPATPRVPTGFDSRAAKSHRATHTASHTQPAMDRSPVTSPMMRTARPGPGKGCRAMNCSGTPSSRPSARTSSCAAGAWVGGASIGGWRSLADIAPGLGETRFQHAQTAVQALYSVFDLSCTHLEQLAQRLDQLELQVLGQAAHLRSQE